MGNTKVMNIKIKDIPNDITMTNALQTIHGINGENAIKTIVNLRCFLFRHNKYNKQRGIPATKGTYILAKHSPI